ncbi:2OG-Fe(II) oxygenase [uncultured Dokdonia sp.]|uniref:2OG-Fe(II) oxygenase n=1 Tax=uncultured Dokdonia sp. TaxID=575653 RepID=UPI00261BB5EA|nr:2OG-Fe(II) oxygenase [uncultured Dokdonia sp.]
MSYKISYIQSEPIIEIDHFISDSECDVLLTSRVQQFQKANSHYPTYYRNNDRYVEDTPSLANQLFIKLKTFGLQSEKDLLDMVSINERIRFCRYQEGQSFSIHQDGVYYINDMQASKYTFLLYLNDDFDGGFTEFYTNKSDTTPSKIVAPKKGKLLVFDHAIWHKGSVVTKGNKYILRSDIIVNIPLQDTHHQGYIWNLTQLDKTRFISCGRDRYIKIWNTNLELLNTFNIHTKSVIKVIRADKDHFVSCSRDFTLKKWTIDGNVVRSIRFREMLISLHKNCDHTIIAAGTSGTIYYLSNKLTIIDRIEVHEDWIWDLIVLPDGRIISCS